MRAHPFGSTGVSVSVIGQGTWQTSKTAKSVESLRRGLDLGLTHIDTAEMYGTEELVGKAIAVRRDQVFLVSMVLPSSASKQGTIAACERSLRRLGTDHLDCYLLHWRGKQPLAETFAAFELLEQQGKVLSWGVSNFDVSDLEEAWALAPPGRPACNQVLYNLQTRGIEHAVLPWCEAHRVAVVAYTPFGQGRWPAPGSTGGRALATIAAALGATPRQVALAWLVRRPSVFAIPKAAKLEHAQENAGAGDLVLTPEDLALIDEVFPVGPRPRSLPTL